MNKVFRRFSTYLFLLLFTLILSNCSSENAALNNPSGGGIAPVDNGGGTGAPDSGNTGTLSSFPINVNANLVCADDSNCSSDQKCVEGICKNKRSNNVFNTKINVCNVGDKECTSDQFCHPNHPNDNLGTCQDKKVADSPCDHDWECQSNLCNDHDNVCSPIPGNNSNNADSKKFSYYLSDTSDFFYSKCTNSDPSTCDSNNSDFKATYARCDSNTFFPGIANVNVIVGLKVTADGDGIQDIQTACQDINKTLTNTIPPWGSSSSGLVDGYFYGNIGEFISGFWVKDANGEHAVVELQPYLAKFDKSSMTSVESATPNQKKWGPGDGAIDAFELHCKPGSAMVSVGGKKYLGYYRSLEIECRKIKSKYQ